MTGLKKNNKEAITNYFDTLFPNPKCELNYTNDYELLIAVMLSAQTTDKRVNQVTEVLFQKYPTLKELQEASLEDIINIIRPVGTFRRKASYLLEIANQLHNDYDGKVPNDRQALESMPGVGRKVANVVLSEWFHEDNIAVDTHVNRVSKRLQIAKPTDSILEVEKKLQKFFPQSEWGRRHLQFVLFGRYYCKSKNPSCNTCMIKEICKR